MEAKKIMQTVEEYYGIKKDLFKSEQEAIDWVRDNTPIIIKAAKKGKYPYVHPFSSNYAFNDVTEYLGKELFKVITNKQ